MQKVAFMQLSQLEKAVFASEMSFPIFVKVPSLPSSTGRKLAASRLVNPSRTLLSMATLTDGILSIAVVPSKRQFPVVQRAFRSAQQRGVVESLSIRDRCYQSILGLSSCGPGDLRATVGGSDCPRSNRLKRKGGGRLRFLESKFANRGFRIGLGEAMATRHAVQISEQTSVSETNFLPDRLGAATNKYKRGKI